MGESIKRRGVLAVLAAVCCLAIQKGVHYTAWADYGIALVDAE